MISRRGFLAAVPALAVAAAHVPAPVRRTVRVGLPPLQWRMLHEGVVPIPMRSRYYWCPKAQPLEPRAVIELLGETNKLLEEMPWWPDVRTRHHT